MSAPEKGLTKRDRLAVSRYPDDEVGRFKVNGCPDLTYTKAWNMIFSSEGCSRTKSEGKPDHLTFSKRAVRRLEALNVAYLSTSKEFIERRLEEDWKRTIAELEEEQKKKALEATKQTEAAP